MTAERDESKLRESTRDPEETPPNPNLFEDLEYDLVDLDVITTDTADDRVVVMPKDEDMLHDEMFVVVGSDGLVDLVDWI